MEKRVECESIWPRCSKSFDSDAAVISCWPRGKNGGELLLNVSSLSNLLSPTLFLSMLRLCTNLVPRSGSRKIFPIFLPPKYYFLICLARISLWNSISRLNRSFFFSSPPFQFKSRFQTRLEETFGRKDPIDTVEIFTRRSLFLQQVVESWKNYFPYQCISPIILNFSGNVSIDRPEITLGNFFLRAKEISFQLIKLCWNSRPAYLVHTHTHTFEN